MSRPQLNRKGERKVGRPPGAANKTTAAVKTAILEAFEKLGGVKYLMQVGKDDPKTFLTLVGKLIPQEIKSELSTLDADGKPTGFKIEFVQTPKQPEPTVIDIDPSHATITTDTGQIPRVC